MDAAVAGGAGQVGWKIGFNTPADSTAPRAASTPVVGYLVDLPVHPDGATVSLTGGPLRPSRSRSPCGSGLLGGTGPPTVIGLAPALELVDLGIPFDDIELVLADNICQRGVVFGDDMSGVDPFAVTVCVTKNGAARRPRFADRGTCRDRPPSCGTSSMTMVPRSSPGQRIIAGSLTPPLAVAPGDALDVAFGPLELCRSASPDADPAPRGPGSEGCACEPSNLYEILASRSVTPSRS